MKILGTHPALNDALERLVKPEKHLDAAAVYIIDNNERYGAPISSYNRKASEADTHHYIETFQRTKLSAKRSAAVRFGLHPKDGLTNSLHFRSHRLRHEVLIPDRFVLQFVTEGETPPDTDKESDAFKLLSDIAENVASYQQTQHLEWGDIFGLRPDCKEYDILVIDINGFSQFSQEDQMRLEIAMTRAAKGFKQSHDMEVFQIIGDEVRFRRPVGKKPADKKMMEDIVETFIRSLKANSKIDDLNVRAVASRGFLSDIFIGDPSTLHASKAFNGTVLTHIANRMKTMDRLNKLVIC